MKKMTRKEFLTTFLGAGLFASASALFISSCVAGKSSKSDDDDDDDDPREKR